MNSVYALMIITMNGVVEAPNTFSSLSDCEKVVQRVQRETYCVEKKPVNIEHETKNLLNIFKNLVKEMDKS